MRSSPKGPENEENAIDCLFESLDLAFHFLLWLVTSAVAESPWSASVSEPFLERSSSLLIVVAIWFVDVASSSI
jgi:hypothetical protein